jgi:hypothetical protein
MYPQPSQAASLTLLCEPPNQAAATILRISRAQIVIETPLEISLNMPLKVAWDKYMVLGEAVDRQKSSDGWVSAIQVAHFVDLERVADHTKFWPFVSS